MKVYFLVMNSKRCIILKWPDHTLADFLYAAVNSRLNSMKPALAKKTLSYRTIKAVDIDRLKSDLMHDSDLHCTDLDELVCSYNNALSAAIDRYIPLLTRTIIVNRPRVLWVDDSVSYKS